MHPEIQTSTSGSWQYSSSSLSYGCMGNLLLLRFDAATEKLTYRGEMVHPGDFRRPSPFGRAPAGVILLVRTVLPPPLPYLHPLVMREYERCRRIRTSSARFGLVFYQQALQLNNVRRFRANPGWLCSACPLPAGARAGLGALFRHGGAEEL